MVSDDGGGDGDGDQRWYQHLTADGRGRTDAVSSLLSETAAVVSDDGATSLLTDAVLSLSSETMVVAAEVASHLTADGRDVVVAVVGDSNGGMSR